MIYIIEQTDMNGNRRSVYVWKKGVTIKMTLQEYCFKYRYSKREAKKLYDICIRSNGKFMLFGHCCIPDDMPPIYIPDYRCKDINQHLLKAVTTQRLLLPETIAITPEVTAAILHDMEKQEIIRRIDPEKIGKETTDYYRITDKTHWNTTNEKEKREYIKAVIEIIAKCKSDNATE